MCLYPLWGHKKWLPTPPKNGFEVEFLFDVRFLFSQKQQMEFLQSSEQTWSLSCIYSWFHYNLLWFFFCFCLIFTVKRELFHTRAHIHTITYILQIVFFLLTIFLAWSFYGKRWTKKARIFNWFLLNVN